MISYRGMNHWSLPVQVFRKWRPLHPKIGIPACAQHCSEMNIVISICRYMRMYRYMYWSTSLNPVIASVYVDGSEMACLPPETRWLPSREAVSYRGPIRWRMGWSFASRWQRTYFYGLGSLLIRNNRRISLHGQDFWWRKSGVTTNMMPFVCTLSSMPCSETRRWASL